MLQLQVTHVNGKIRFVDIRNGKVVELNHDQLITLFEALGSGLTLDVRDDRQFDQLMAVLMRGTATEA